MNVHLINPSHVSFGTAVITPRWQYVLAGATPTRFGDPILVDETLSPMDPERIQRGDAVGISIHTANALRGYEIGTLARKRGAYVIFGGIHATLYPEEARQLGGAHSIVTGDGDVAWPNALADCEKGTPQPLYHGGKIEASDFVAARWELIPRSRYMWASVQTVRGCPKHCSFCSVWRTDGQRPRQRASDAVMEEVVQLRRLGFRFIALADDNFYPVTLTDLNLARMQKNSARITELETLRAERFELMARLAQLPDDMVFFTQITMEAAEDTDFLDAMKAARIKGALVGVEAVTPAGLKDVYKDFNLSGEHLIERLKIFRARGVHVLGSFIFGLPSDRPETFDATAAAAISADLTFAQFVTLSPYPGTVDFDRWEKGLGDFASDDCGGAAYAAVAYSAGAASQAVLGPSGDDGGRDTVADASGLGQFLQHGFDLEAVEVYQVEPGAVGFRFDFKNISPDVCRHWDRYRQCASLVVGALGAMAGEALPAAVCWSSHA